MGLEVAADGTVRITDRHERLLETRAGGRCYTSPAEGGIVVAGVFRRNRVGDGRDGMPLMNALKGRDGYSSDPRSIALLRRRARQRLLGHFKNDPVDVVVPAPSSSLLTLALARQLARVLGPPVAVADLLRKATVAETLASAGAAGRVRPTDQDLYDEALRKLRRARQGQLVAAKGIHPRVRRYFTLVHVQHAARLTPGLRIVVVDDSSMSGATLGDSVRALNARFAPASVKAVALVGP